MISTVIFCCLNYIFGCNVLFISQADASLMDSHLSAIEKLTEKLQQGEREWIKVYCRGEGYGRSVIVVPRGAVGE